MRSSLCEGEGMNASEVKEEVAVHLSELRYSWKDNQSRR